MTDVNGEVRAFNEVWNAWLVTGREPVRCCVQAVLQGGAKVEVALTAAIPGSAAGKSS
jgi:enamine deaminase RidA (YjgF/YER057c/UK114 family)